MRCCWKIHASLFSLILAMAPQAQGAAYGAKTPLPVAQNSSFPSREEIANMTTTERRALGPRAFSDDQLEPNDDTQPLASQPQETMDEALSKESKRPARPTQEEIDNMTTAERRALGAWAFADPEPANSKALGDEKRQAPPEENDNMTTAERRAAQKAADEANAAAKRAKTTPTKTPKFTRPAEPTFRDPSKQALGESFALFSGLLFVLWLGARRIIKKSKARPLPFKL